MKRVCVAIILCLYATGLYSQELVFGKQVFDLKNVKAGVVKFNGEDVIKIERDLNALPFDITRLESTVDEPTYAKLRGLNFENGRIEVKLFSQIQQPSPFESAQGFIGLAFRIDQNDKAFESIYLRPKVGRSDNQMFRNHTVQYFAYPDFKFDTLRKMAPGMYETTAPVNINEWITLRVEVTGDKAELFVNDSKYSTMIVSKMRGKTKEGAIALWVDIGTIGYLKDLKITRYG